LSAWLREHLHSWAGHARAADLSLETSPGVVRAAVHPALLGQLVDNLLDNACKYSAAGTPVTVALSTAEGGSRLAVADHGEGFAAFLVAVAAAASSGGCAAKAPEGAAGEEVNPAPVKAAAPRLVFFGEWTDLFGAAQPVPGHLARITAPVEGRVLALDATEGQ